MQQEIRQARLTEAVAPHLSAEKRPARVTFQQVPFALAAWRSGQLARAFSATDPRLLVPSRAQSGFEQRLYSYRPMRRS